VIIGVLTFSNEKGEIWQLPYSTLAHGDYATDCVGTADVNVLLF
jgi:hypothetical protein